MVDYKKQYLKYKKKYLQIKNKNKNKNTNKITIGGTSKTPGTPQTLHYKFSDPKFSKVLPDLNNTFLKFPQLAPHQKNE